MFYKYNKIGNVQLDQLCDDFQICVDNIERIVKDKYKTKSCRLIVTGSHASNIATSYILETSEAADKIKDFDFIPFTSDLSDIYEVSGDECLRFGMTLGRYVLDPLDRMVFINKNGYNYCVNVSQAECCYDVSTGDCFASEGFLRSLETNMMYPPVYWENQVGYHDLKYVLGNTLESFINPFFRAKKNKLEFDRLYIEYLNDVLYHCGKVNYQHTYIDLPKYLEWTGQREYLLKVLAHYMNKMYVSRDWGCFYASLLSLEKPSLNELAEIRYRMYKMVQERKVVLFI